MKTIFKNERGVPTLHIEPETDTEREQLKNVTSSNPGEQLLLNKRLKIQNLMGGGISVHKFVPLNEGRLEKWGFYPLSIDDPDQFSYELNKIYISTLFPKTIIVGNGTYRVFHHVDYWWFLVNSSGDRYALGEIIPMKGFQIKKFVVRTVAEMAEAMSWGQKNKTHE